MLKYPGYVSHEVRRRPLSADLLRLAQLAPSWFQNEHSSQNPPYGCQACAALLFMPDQPSSDRAFSAKLLSTRSVNSTRFLSTPLNSMISSRRLNDSSVITGVDIHESVSR